MDYRFFFNERQIPQAELSMDHEAIGTWLSEELGNNPEKLSEILTAINAILAQKQREYRWQGHEFLLLLDREDAQITALSLLQEYQLEELEDESLELYDAELRAQCGLEDFHELLLEWQDFIC
ncbi:MAG: YacL family protein [Venatoribacter sp.]